MVEHSFENVTGELRGSGLLDLMYPQYRMLPSCMAEMADVCGGREFPATHTQIAKRSGGCRHGSMTPELVAELIFDFIRLGIVEVAPASGPVTCRTGIGKNEWRPGAVDISMDQVRSAQSKARKWGIRRYLAVRRGPSSLSFLMEIPNGSPSLPVSTKRARRLRC